MAMSNEVASAIKAAGSQGSLAAALFVSQPTVSEWLRGVRPVPAEKAAEMERLYWPAVAADRLPGRWARLPDPAWPHPAGRPCIDVAAPELITPAHPAPQPQGERDAA